MTIVKDYLVNFLITEDNKLQTLHFTKCLFEVPPIARFPSNCTTAVKKSRELKIISLVSLPTAPSCHALNCSVAISLSEVNHLLLFFRMVYQLIILLLPEHNVPGIFKEF